MSLLVLLTGLALVAGNLWLYRRQRLRYPAMNRPDRQAFEVSAPTRAFETVKYLFYLGLVAHLLLETLAGDAPGGLAFALGAGLGVLGLWLLDRSFEALGDNYAPCGRAVLPFERVRTGPYRVLDHPLYAGNLLLFVGIAVMSPGWLIFACCAALVFFYAFAIRDENRALRRHFSREAGTD